MKLRLLLLLAISALLVLPSCKDDEPTVKEQLIGSWQVTQEKYTEDGVTEIYEGEGLGDPCDRDDLVIFKDNNTVAYDEGPTKCDPDAPQVYGTENWSLLNDDTQIQFSSDGDVYAVTIASLNKSTLVMSESGTDTDIEGNTYTYSSEITLSKQ